MKAAKTLWALVTTEENEEETELASFVFSFDQNSKCLNFFQNLNELEPGNSLVT
jgi:hypothetical protein